MIVGIGASGVTGLGEISGMHQLAAGVTQSAEAALRVAQGVGVAMLACAGVCLVGYTLYYGRGLMLSRAAGTVARRITGQDRAGHAGGLRPKQARQLAALERELADVSVMLADDVAGLRRMFVPQLDYCDDETLAAAFTGHAGVVGLARTVGWDDPQVRETVRGLLESRLGGRLR